MVDFLDTLAKNAKVTINSNFYDEVPKSKRIKVNLKQKIIETKKTPIIAEIKTASPSLGIIRKKFNITKIAESMENGGAVAISVLTEPKHFGGSLDFLATTRKAVKIPILMKDIILNPVQLEAANNIGANVVLFIQALFDRGYCKLSLDKMIAVAHSKGLEVLLETHNEKEFSSALESSADLIGINNRDLSSLKVNLTVTKKILENFNSKDKIVVSESGINIPADVNFLQKCGAKAFLIGSSIMKSNNVEEKVKEFVSAF